LHIFVDISNVLFVPLKVSMHISGCLLFAH